MSDPSAPQGLLGLFGDWRELIIVWGLATLGGLAKLAQVLLTGKDEGTYVKRGAKLFLAGFAGLLFYWLAADWAIRPQWKALGIALAGHMGAEAIELLVRGLRLLALRWLGAEGAAKDAPAADTLLDRKDV